MVTDELTPREREVFELLRVGLTNEEIADRLGISLDGAKYHVSSILSKLGVSSREEAAAVRQIPVADPPRRQMFARIVLIGVAAAVLGAVALLGVGVFSTGGGSDDIAATQEASLTLPPGADPLTEAIFTPQDNHPLIGQDHWHVSYTIWIGDQKQPNAPTWESGVHTHGDGIIHIHPFQSFEEGPGAALSKWFEYGGGELTATSMREPGASPDTTVHNGDPVPGDGRPGEVFVFLGGCGNVALEGNWLRVPVNYVPHDADQLCIMFEPEALMRERIQNPPGFPATPVGTPTPVCTTTEIGARRCQYPTSTLPPQP